MGAVGRRRAGQDLTGLVHHSDRGVQYRAIRYTERLADAAAVASVGGRGDSYDNAMAEARNSPGYDGTTAGTSYEIDGQTLRTNALIDHLGCQASGDTAVGTYEWQLREDRLEFELVRDDCQARVELFTGQMWSRAP